MNVSQAARQYYFGKGPINEQNKEKLVIALTDRNFISCTAEAALAQSKYGPVYLYTMNYQGSSSFLNEWGVRDKIKMRGVVQNDELPQLFNLGFQSLPELKKGEKDTGFSEKVVKLWTEFARTGKPTEKYGNTEFEWSPVLPSQSTSSLKWYQLDSTSQSQALTIPAPTFKFWEGVDLGRDEGYIRDHQDGSIPVGYEMTQKPTVKPITPPPPKTLIHHPLPASSATPSKSPSPTSGGLTYGLAPNSAAAFSTPSTSTTTTTTTTAKPVSSVTPKPTATPAPKPTSSSEEPPPVIHAVFKDDDPYSSTTTTTTKKPGFFSKILG